MLKDDKMKNEQLTKLIRLCEQESMEPFVFSCGNTDARIMLVGEAPGAKEIELGKPFVGQAGKNLDEFLEIIALDRKDIYITNVVKIRPHKVNEKTGRKSNRPPNVKEIEKYSRYLYEEIAIIQPELIVTLGNVPLKTVIGKKDVIIGNIHGIPQKQDDYYIFPLYHPASIIYNQSLKSTYMNDLTELKKFIEKLY